MLRLNHPVLPGHEADVGTRTDLMIFDASHRRTLPARLRRHPSVPVVPTLCTTPGEGAGPPGLALALLEILCDLACARPATGMKAPVLAGVILQRPVTVFGYDFFRPGGRGHHFDRAAAPFTHETGFEAWFVRRLPPVPRPGVRLDGEG